MPPTRRSKRKTQADEPLKREEKHKHKKKSHKKTESRADNEVMTSGTKLTEGLGAFKNSPSAQSISSAANKNKVLDLDVSYVGKFKAPPKPPKPPRHRRWKHKGKEPLEDPTQLPDDWTESEPDLSDDDYDGQIQRCQERIKDNILVSRFEEKLELLKADKAQRDFWIDSEPYGLEWPVIQRLRVLKDIEENLSEEDPYDQLVTVRAIMRAYRYHQLEWNDGLVTYWVKDQQLCQPRPFDWDEVDQLKEKYANDTSFWIEGGSTPAPAPLNHTLAVPPDRIKMHFVKCSFRLPGQHITNSMWAMDDTGASISVLYEFDVKSMIHPRPAYIPLNLIIGRLAVTTTNGGITPPVIRVEISVTDGQTVLVPWTPIQAILMPGRFNGRNSNRLIGPALRSKAFTATAPDNHNQLFISTDRAGIINSLPDPDVSLSTVQDLAVMPQRPGRKIF